jgi:phosphatidylinositol alpha-1,6-mannosyltransferase
LNLLLVATDFPPKSGGISTYTKEFGRALGKICQVLVLAPGTWNREVSDTAYPFQVIRTPPFAILSTLFFFIYIPLLLRRHRIDAVLHTVWPTALISHFWHFLFPVPYFVSVHASEILDDRLTWRRRLKSYLSVWRVAAFKKAAGIFPVSQYSAGLLTDLGIDPNRIQVLMNGVDPKRFKPAVTRRSKNGQKQLLTVARLDLHKGHDRVLQALAILRDQGLTPRYIIAGEGDEEARLRALATGLGLERQVEFAGFIPDSQLPDIYAECDIFIMASREIPGRSDLVEGFGISFLEASASGLPVIAGRSGGVADAVRDGETGLLVDPDDPQDIAKALKLLLTDTKLARRFAKNGREWTVTQMSWEYRAKRLIDAVIRLM